MAVQRDAHRLAWLDSLDETEPPEADAYEEDYCE
jgi:hypothetical protein